VDAEQTVDTMVQTAGSFPAVAAALPGGEGLRAVLRERGARWVDFPGWRRVDAEEVRRGQAAGKLREKVTSVEEMLQIAGVA
jgi:adrenodoxin-NADP+ reductase